MSQDTVPLLVERDKAPLTKLPAHDAAADDDLSPRLNTSHRHRRISVLLVVLHGMVYLGLFVYLTVFYSGPSELLYHQTLLDEVFVFPVFDDAFNLTVSSGINCSRLSICPYGTQCWTCQIGQQLLHPAFLIVTDTNPHKTRPQRLSLSLDPPTSDTPAARSYYEFGDATYQVRISSQTIPDGHENRTTRSISAWPTEFGQNRTKLNLVLEYNTQLTIELQGREPYEIVYVAAIAAVLGIEIITEIIKLRRKMKRA